jgi:hypothetical protein
MGVGVAEAGGGAPPSEVERLVGDTDEATTGAGTALGTGLVAATGASERWRTPLSTVAPVREMA